MKNYRKVYVFFGAGFGLIIILAVLSLVLVKRLVTPERVRGELLAFLSEKIGGAVGFENVELNFFPGPHVVLKGGTFSVPDGLDGSFETLVVYPKALPLLRGEFEVSRLKIIKPVIKLLIKKEVPAEASGEREGFGEFRDGVDRVLSYLDTHGRGLNAEIENGTLVVQKDSVHVLSFRAVNADIALPDDGLRVEISSESNLWDAFDFKSSIDLRNYKGSGSLVVTDGKPHKLMDFYMPDKKLVSDSSVNLSMKFSTSELKIFQAKIFGSVPKLVLTGHDKVLEFSTGEISADLYSDGQKQVFKLESAKLINPGLDLSGKYTAETVPGRVTLSLLGKNVKVGSVREGALFVAGEDKVVDGIFDVVRGGTVPGIKLDAKAGSFEDLWKEGNFRIEGNMADGEIHIPGVEFDLVGANGNAVIADGMLKGDNLRGKLGNSTGYDGTLLVGLEGPAGPLDLDIAIDADPSQIPSVLKQFVHDEGFGKEMDLIKDVKGKAKGRLVVTGQKGSAEAKVYASEFEVSADYGRFPYPVSVKGGTFDYEDMKIDVTDLDVSMGKSSSSIVSGSYEWKENNYLAFSSSGATVDLGELYPWLASFVSLKPRLKDIESAHGTAFFKTLEFAGTVTNPADWKISGKGRLSAVNLNLAGFNDLITISGADIKSTPGRLSVSNAGVSVHDSNISLSMELTDYLTSLINMKMDFAGTLDPGTMKNLSEYIDLPKELVFNTPLSVTDSSLELGDGGRASSEDLDLRPGTPSIRPEKKLNLNVNIRTDTLEWRDAGTNAAAEGETQGNTTWSSPVTGTVRVKSENFIFKKLSWDTLNAAVKLFEHGIDIDITHAELCGISTPGKLQVYPPGLRFEFKPSTSDEDLASVMKCLLNKAGIISGELQFNAVVSSKGGSQDVYKNLEGGMELTSRNGRVDKYGGLAKFFNILNFGELFRGQGPDFNKQGFPYDKLTAKADMKDGKVIIKQAAMDGPSIKVVCEGFIDLVNEKLDLQLLVIPVMAVDSVISKIPIVNFVLGKNFVSIPIRVKGDIADPKVETISPSDISFGLFGLIKQTLNIPATIFKPISGKAKNADNNEEVSKGINSGGAGHTGE